MGVYDVLINKVTFDMVEFVLIMLSILLLEVSLKLMFGKN
jgi:hypothetical protein